MADGPATEPDSDDDPRERVDANDHPGRAIEDAAIERVAARAPTRLDRQVLRATEWLGDHTAIRLGLILGFMTLALGQAIVMFIFEDEVTDRLAGASYFSIFITNLASTATVFVPVPGLTAAAQALIIDQGEAASYPWLIGIAGGLGMAVGEITAYYSGYLGAEFMRGRELPGPRRFHGTIQKVVGGIDWLMDRWGMATLFVLSAVPNPLFEIAGLTAGSVRMPFRRFMLSVTVGKCVRGVLLAYLGTQLPFV